MVHLWVWEILFGTHLGDLGSRSPDQATEAGEILPCPHDNVRTNHPIAAQLFLTDCFVKFQMRLWEWDFKVESRICYISAKNGSIATKQKANTSIERRPQMG